MLKTFYTHFFTSFRCETRAHAHVSLFMGRFALALCTCVRAGSTKEIKNYCFLVVRKKLLEIFISPISLFLFIPASQALSYALFNRTPAHISSTQAHFLLALIALCVLFLLFCLLCLTSFGATPAKISFISFW